MMELSLRSRHWSVFQVVAIVVCYRGQVLSERAQGCVESQLSLSCPEMKVIRITAVVIGDTHCLGASCCIKDDDCTYAANENHRKDVNRTCDNKRSCTVGVLQERIPCGYWGVWYKNDFERITYICIDNPQNGTTTTTDTQSKVNEHEKDITPEDRSGNPLILPVVMTIVCLLVLIAIVVVTVMMCRKKWPKVSAAVEMTNIDNSNRNDTAYENDNQTVIPNTGSESPIYSNDKIKKSRNKGAKASKTYEVPINAVYSLADGAGSRSTEDSNVYCDAESRESTYQEPRLRSNVYSLARDVGEPECAGSTADASNGDNNVYCDVETTEPAKAGNSSTQNAYDEAIIWKKSENKAMREDKTIPPAQKKKTDRPVHKAVQELYTKINKPSKNAAAFDPSGKVEPQDKVSTSYVFPNPIYETMSPVIPESIYANSPPLSPSSSVASKTLLTGGTETENPYCEMKSTPVKLKDDGSQTVVENDLYSH